MARARMIKPEFFVDERVAECSTSARLLFIGMWVFADDYGNIEASHLQLKMQVFPADTIDCKGLVAEIEAAGLITRYAEKYFHINNFDKHQTIDRKSKPRCPLYEPSTSPLRVVAEPAPVEVEEKLKPLSPNSDPAVIERVIHHLNLKSDKKFRSDTAGNAKIIKARLAEGFTEDQLKEVIDNQCRVWKGTDMEQYLRPATLFLPGKIDGYLNNTPVVKGPSAIESFVAQHGYM